MTPTINELPNATAGDIANEDLLPFVDVSAGVTKHITYGDFLAGVSGDISDTLDAAEAYADLPLAFHNFGGAHTFDLTDAGNVLVQATGATLQTFTIPTNAAVAFPTGTAIWLNSFGAGGIHIIGTSPVTISGATADLAQGDSRTLIKQGTNAWWGMSA